MCSTWKSWEGSRSWSWTTRYNCKENSGCKSNPGYISSKLILVPTGGYLVIELICHMSKALHFLVLKWEEMKTEESPCKSHIWPNCHHLILQQCCGFFKESFYGAVFQTKLHWSPFYDVFQFDLFNNKIKQVDKKGISQEKESDLYSSWLSKPTASGHSDMHRVLM